MALQNGFIGNENDWLTSLIGEQGQSAYQLAVALGFEGTPSDWLQSLVGATGPQGLQGLQRKR